MHVYEPGKVVTNAMKQSIFGRLRRETRKRMPRSTVKVTENCNKEVPNELFASHPEGGGRNAGRHVMVKIKGHKEGRPKEVGPGTKSRRFEKNRTERKKEQSKTHPGSTR